MANVTVTCGCGRAMAPELARGAFRCGCGTTVRVAVSEPPACSSAADDGSKCRTVPSREAALLGLSLCADHFTKLAEMFEALHLDEATRAGAAREAELDAREERLREREWDVNNLIEQWSEDSRTARRAIRVWHDRRDQTVDWYVYYVRIGDVIKIGTTGAFKQRMNTLMPDEILAVEPGGLQLERLRHREFAHLRVRGERFSPGDDLMAHIASVRAEHPEFPEAGTPRLVAR
jgi:hypothetical protein